MQMFFQVFKIQNEMNINNLEIYLNLKNILKKKKVINILKNLKKRLII